MPVLASLGRSRGDKADAIAIERLRLRQKDRQLEDAKAEVKALKRQLAGLEASVGKARRGGVGGIEEIKARGKCAKVEGEVEVAREKASN